MTPVFARGLVPAAATLALGLAADAAADPVADFYAGKHVTIAVVAAGGAYGANGQMLAEHMGRYIPGEPGMSIQVKSGAGGRTLMNWLYNVAPRDGTALGFIHKDVAAFSQLESKGAKYEADGFQWIGSVAPMITVMFVRKDAGATTIEGLKTTEVTMGASGKSHPTALFPRLLNQAMGARLKVVTGYRGSADIFLAVERGEVSGTTFTWDTVRAQKPDWAEKGEIVPLVQFALEKDRDLPDTPLLADILPAAEDKAMARFLTSGSKVGRAFAAPPGVSAERVAALRKAFDAVVKDEAYLAHAKRARMPVDPVSGEELQALVTSVAAAPKSVVARAKDAMGM